MSSGTDGTSSIELQGVKLDYVRRGSGPTMLLLHGGGGPQAAMPFFDRLTEKFDVVAPVHPGFAGSKIPDHFDNMEDLVYLHLDLMDALDLKDTIMMGFSMGGWAATEIAVRTTQRLSKLILVDSVGIKPGGPMDRDIADVFAVPGQELAKLMFHDPAKGPDMSKMTDEQLSVVAANRIALGLYTWQPYMHNPKLPHRLHRIDVPTLLVWGASDGLVKVEYGEAFRDMIPGAKMVVVPEAGHSPQAEQPDIFVDHILSFAAS